MTKLTRSAITLTNAASLCVAGTLAFTGVPAASATTTTSGASTSVSDEVNRADTVRSIAPLTFNIADVMPSQLQGKICPCTPVDYPAALGEWSINAGVDALDAAVAEAGDTPTVIFAYSEGGQVVARWLAAQEEGASRDNITFVIIGMPEGAQSFRVQNGFADAIESNGYKVISISKEYDGWADWPDRFGLLSVANAVAGMWLIHPDYSTVDPDDPNAARYTQDGVEYVVVPTDIVPLAIPLSWINEDWAKSVSDQLRPIINQDYDRPIPGAVQESVTPPTNTVSTTEEGSDSIASDDGEQNATTDDLTVSSMELSLVTETDTNGSALEPVDHSSDSSTSNNGTEPNASAAAPETPSDRDDPDSSTSTNRVGESDNDNAQDGNLD